MLDSRVHGLTPVLLPTWTLYVCVHAGATVTRSARGEQLGHVLIFFFFQKFFFSREAWKVDSID